MNKKFQPHGAAGGETFKKGIWFRAQKLKGVIISLRGRRGPFESPYFDIPVPGDKESENKAEAKIADWLHAEIAKQPSEWRKFIIPGGTYKGKTLEYVYATDLRYLIEMGSKEKAPVEVLQAIEHKLNFDPWSRF